MEIRVRVTPNGRRERVTKIGEHALQVVVREPAEQNRANDRVRAMLAEIYDVSITAVHIRTGHKSRTKVYTIRDAQK